MIASVYRGNCPAHASHTHDIRRGLGHASPSTPHTINFSVRVAPRGASLAWLRACVESCFACVLVSRSVCARVCGCVCVCACVCHESGTRGECVCGCGAVVKTTCRTPPGHGFDPHQEGRHILPGCLPMPFRTPLVPPFLAREPPGSLASPLMSHTHSTHAHTHTHTYAHIHLSHTLATYR